LAKFNKWKTRSFFSPDEFRKADCDYLLNKIYLPFYVFHAETETTYKGEGGMYYYATETRQVRRNGFVVSENFQARRIRWTMISGTYQLCSDNQTEPASDRIDNNLLTKISDIDLNDHLNSDELPAAGYPAADTSVPFEKSWENAKERITAEIESKILQELRFDTYRLMEYQFNFKSIGHKIIWVPFWLMNFEYKNKTYQFAMNGETGAISGKKPISAFKVAAGIITILAVVFLSAMAFYLGRS
jgi:hypothetical protein